MAENNVRKKEECWLPKFSLFPLVVSVIFFYWVVKSQNTVKPVLETTCIKRPLALRDHCSNTTTLLNPFPNTPWFLPVCSRSLLKTLWEKEKLLVVSNFSFSHNAFYLFEELSAIFIKFKIVICKLFQFGRVQNLSFGKGLNQPSGTCI